jgi:hypothetical protein
VNSFNVNLADRTTWNLPTTRQLAQAGSRPLNMTATFSSFRFQVLSLSRDPHLFPAANRDFWRVSDLSQRKQPTSSRKANSTVQLVSATTALFHQPLLTTTRGTSTGQGKTQSMRRIARYPKL